MNIITFRKHIISFLKHIKKRIVISWQLWFTGSYFVHFYPKSFAQAGEDLILYHLFTELRIKQPTYIDIGTNHPVAFNNTYFFYNAGSRGVCVEPDPSFIPKLKRYRRNDIIVNAGVGLENVATAEFYIFDDKAMSTFSKEEAEYRESFGTHKIIKIMQIPLKNINDLLRENFSTCPNLISLDVEGLDLRILKSMDFDKYRPDAICVETLGYDEGKSGRKLKEIEDFVTSKDYVVYADTHINTIFVAAHHFPHLK